MDRVIQKKKWTRKRIITISDFAGIVLLIAASYYFTRGGNKLDVETDRITISEVTKGKFQENYSGEWSCASSNNNLSRRC